MAAPIQHDAQDIQQVTAAISTEAPDAKTRRYDRQLRLWAATGQAALESARLLVLGGSATCTSTLKNLVLPGIGHFTILDPHKVTPADAGNNFFLEGPSSIGKHRAEEAVRLLLELNDGVDGKADTRSLESVISTDEGKTWIKSFSLVIAHNLDKKQLDELSTLLWEDEAAPALAVVRTAGFLAEFYFQYHKHEIIETHSDDKPSLRIDKPFPELAKWAEELDLPNMNTTDHSHIPYVVLLVRALQDWKKQNGGAPKTDAEKSAFKTHVSNMRIKADEENIDEAYAKAYTAYVPTTVPSDIRNLISADHLTSVTPTSPIFDRLLAALKTFTDKNGVLPLTSSLPDMHSDTTNYIRLQTLYKMRANAEKAELWSYIVGEVDDAIVDAFVKNAHALRVLEGRKYGALDQDPELVGMSTMLTANPKYPALHYVFSALTNVIAGQAEPKPTEEAIRKELKRIVGDAELLDSTVDEAIGELVRAPTADMPNVAALVGGLVAQESIKLITKQYVAINGYCVVNLTETFTGIVNA